MSGPFAGAVMITFFAPAARCFAAPSRLVKMPVDSNTTSTPRSFHGSCAGSLTDSTLNSSPSTVMPSPLALTSASQVAEDRVVLQQVRKRGGVGEVVDRDEVDVLRSQRRAHDVAPDAPEPVDPDLDGHRVSSARMPVSLALVRAT